MKTTQALAVLCSSFLVALLGCGTVVVNYVATDGQVFRKTGDGAVTGDDVLLEAVRASAANDLACPPTQIATRALIRIGYEADGCGQRASYRTIDSSSGDTFTKRLVLTARFPLQPGQPAVP
jgi:hypothetical protein